MSKERHIWIRWVIGILFLWTAISKFFDPHATLVALSTILPFELLQYFIFSLVIASELYIVSRLIYPARGDYSEKRSVFRFTQAMLLLFILFLGYLLTLAKPPACGCGGLCATVGAWVP